MLPTFITIVSVIVLWTISTQRKLAMLDENISNAMSQIGVQLSSRFDALTALLDLTKGYAKHESETLIETIKSRRSVMTSSNGGGGGESSSHKNSPVIVTPPALDKPNFPIQGEIKGFGTVNSKGNITVNITDKPLADSFDQYGVKADAPKNLKYTPYTMLWLIARKLGCTISELERLNDKSRFDLIHPGDAPQIPEK
ncbi:LemA family protein [Clostridium sp. BSD9I1]|uniref:LemA family protein n=1 Tax=Clostridium sp. BSD9I1 TaxID=2003589 RepID=UPI001FA8BD73|nr:LemA family protein [Clostridium sp. BSD9I1]